MVEFFGQIKGLHWVTSGSEAATIECLKLGEKRKLFRAAGTSGFSQERTRSTFAKYDLSVLNSFSPARRAMPLNPSDRWRRTPR